MNEYVTLLGAEDVRAAGHQIEQAADTMRNAAGELETTLQREAQRRDEFLDRFEDILKSDRAAVIGDTVIINSPLETTCCEYTIPAGKVVVVARTYSRKLLVMIKGEGGCHKVKRGAFNRAVAPL